MSRIHPSESNCNNLLRNEKASPCALTVLKRSSMSFHGTDGFTVFDENGGLAFRVDNYSRKNHGLVLMDGPGTPLLTLKPQVSLFCSFDYASAAKIHNIHFSERIEGRVETTKLCHTSFTLGPYVHFSAKR